MKPDSRSQSGHNRPEPRAPYWRDVPVDVLQQFGESLNVRFTVRELAEMLGISRTAVNDFVERRTTPEKRTVQAFAQLFFEYHPDGYVEGMFRDDLLLPQLKAVLPDGESAAIAWIDRLVALGENDGMSSEHLHEMREWMVEVVRRQYATDRKYAAFERKRRPKNRPDLPSRSRKKKPKPEEE
jgi:transcriptional regulator with XRE-family HTH domain